MDIVQNNCVKFGNSMLLGNVIHPCHKVQSRILARWANGTSIL